MDWVWLAYIQSGYVAGLFIVANRRENKSFVRLDGELGFENDISIFQSAGWRIKPDIHIDASGIYALCAVDGVSQTATYAVVEGCDFGG